MTKKLLTSVAAGALLLGYGVTGASAADVSPVVMVAAPPAPMAPAPEPKHHGWNGGYVGGHAGIVRGAGYDGSTCMHPDDDDDVSMAWGAWWTFGDGGPLGPRLDDDDDSTFGYCFDYAGGGSIDQDLIFHGEVFDELTELNGYSAGAQIGFRRQLGNGAAGLVVGAEVAHSITSVQDTVGGYDEFLGFEWFGIFEMNSLTTATVQAGLGLGPVLVYGEFGLAIGTFSYTNNVGFAESDTAHGIVWGAGVEFAIGHGVSVFAEYNRVNLKEIQMLGTMAEGLPTPPGSLTMLTDIDVMASVFKVGFNIHIGHEHHN